MPGADAVILGAGPSGLAAAYELTRHGASVRVLERLEQVGGLARTIQHDGCRFDIGPHRFFTRNEEVHQLFVEVVAEDLLRVARLTRIHYRNKLFNYPLSPVNALFGVGPASAVLMFLSYARARLRHRLAPRPQHTFEEWMIDHFGARLYETFFKTYTEKVWGISCDRIGADWAAQRIKGLSLGVALKHALLSPKKHTVKTLVDEFLFPRHGAGMFYEKLADLVEVRGGTILLGRRVVGLRRDGMRIRSVVAQGPDGQEEEVEAAQVLSSMPLIAMVEMLEPPPPEAVLAACRRLRYRGHLGVHLKVRGLPFPDNWIYVHSREVRMARVANYRNFSPQMADGEGTSPLTVEYFAFEGDDFWKRADEELIEVAADELRQMGFVHPRDVLSGFVVRSQQAYPVIELGYHEHIAIIKAWLDRLTNLQPIGRSGMFKYNNQDHAIATGLLAARNVLGLGRYDPWLVNIDAEYHEGGEAR
ncbi:MAG: NAD(P)/FAD-dependent oxidoreductase [Candidatus Tectomicrobia bacterium]|nr:NAD(P)/FAD-dependent oxidoreductase [Candidatus Tectomicrobia bacterium]